jgi:hypothetical protein
MTLALNAIFNGEVWQDLLLCYLPGLGEVTGKLQLLKKEHPSKGKRKEELLGVEGEEAVKETDVRKVKHAALLASTPVKIASSTLMSL